jgi:hypothetical protein
MATSVTPLAMSVAISGQAMVPANRAGARHACINSMGLPATARYLRAKVVHREGWI